MPHGESRASTFRHVFGQSPQRGEWFDWGAGHATAIDANPKFLAVALEGGAGGQILVGRLLDVGKHGSVGLTRLHDHKDTVLDLQWNPFNDNILASASADSTVRVWYITDDLQATCVRSFSRHSRRVESIEWHGVVDNVLLTSSTDGSIALWDIEGDRVLYQVNDCFASGISFCPDSSLLAVVSKQTKRVSVLDARTGVERWSAVLPHDGNMAPRVMFVSSNRLVTLGNSRIGRRQLAVFRVDPKSLIADPPLVMVDVDGASGQLCPLLDRDLGLLYVTGKGDSTVRSYELLDSAPWVVYLSESQQSSSHSTICTIAKRALHLQATEIMRVYRLQPQSLLIQPLSFIVPRRDDCFHSDLYPPTRSPTASCSLAEWLAGLKAQPVPLQLRPGLPVGTSKPVTLKGVTGSPKLVTTDINNDRKFRFLSQVTKADYRIVDERDDCAQILQMEEVKQKLQIIRDNSISSSSEEHRSEAAADSDVTTASDIPLDAAMMATDTDTTSLATSCSAQPDVDDERTSIAETLTEEVENSLEYIEPKASDDPQQEQVEEPLLPETADMDPDPCHELPQEDTNDYPEGQPVELPAPSTALTSSDVDVRMDELHDSTGDIGCPADLPRLAADLLAHVLPPPRLPERLLLVSHGLDESAISESETEMLSPVMSPKKTHPGVISPRHRGTVDSARSVSSASSGRRRPVDEPLEMETNPFMQYFQTESPKHVVTNGLAAIATVEEDLEENGNGHDGSIGGDSTGGYGDECGQRLLENTVSMLEKQLRRADGRADQLERLCEMQQRDMDSLRFEIEWKDERIEYLQRTLAELEARLPPPPTTDSL